MSEKYLGHGPPIRASIGELFDSTDKLYFTPKVGGHPQVILGAIPSKSNCYRIVTFRSKDPLKKSHATLAKTKELAKYEKDFILQCQHYRNARIDEPFEIEVDVYYPNNRSDLDNSLKVLLDMLQKVNAIKNDNKCTRIVANKYLDQDQSTTGWFIPMLPPAKK